jgi:para-aminobenzoate synthetase component 1
MSVPSDPRPTAIRQSLDVPSHRLAPVIGGWPGPALLESGIGFGAGGRWSILAAFPRLVWEATDRRWSLRADDQIVQSGEGDVLEALAEILRRYDLANPAHQIDPALPPFQGGLIGYLGFDLAPLIERLPRRRPRDSRMPDIRLGLYDTAVIVDNHTSEASLCAWDLTNEGTGAAERRCRDWRDAIGKCLRNPAAIRISELGPIVSGFGRHAYLATVRQALDYIAAGDIFQVNLSQRFYARGKPEPLDLYLRLKERSPAPFAAFLAWPDMAVISSSPELFYECRGREVVTRPIKGTRPRRADHFADAQLAAELHESPKDRAELIMIVDLERNDLGRVCEYGTISVRDSFQVESFAQVHHLVATVEGRLWPSCGPIDLIRAVFPGGSITGAPKIRAMEIIDELELNRRGVYTGAIGYFSRGGTSAFNIAIRTMLVEGDRASFQVGGGIVADSEPVAEFDETLAKGRGLLSVLNPKASHEVGGD